MPASYLPSSPLQCSTCALLTRSRAMQAPVWLRDWISSRSAPLFPSESQPIVVSSTPLSPQWSHRLLPQLLEELVQKRDNARGLSRIDNFACLKQARHPPAHFISSAPITTAFPFTTSQLLQPASASHSFAAADRRQLPAHIACAVGHRYSLQTRA